MGKVDSCRAIIPLGAAEEEMGNWPEVVPSHSTADFSKAGLQILLAFDLERTIYSKPILDSFLSPLNTYFGQQFFGKMQLSLMNCFSHMSLSLYRKFRVIYLTCSRDVRQRLQLFSILTGVFPLLGSVHWWGLLAMDRHRRKMQYLDTYQTLRFVGRAESKVIQWWWYVTDCTLGPIGPRTFLPLLPFMRQNERRSMKSIHTLKMVL